jgi:L-ribulose-5-phosphate 4-epimerase
MMTELKEFVWKANLDLFRSGLVLLTFGNVSGIDRRRGILAIKPSGVPY